MATNSFGSYLYDSFSADVGKLYQKRKRDYDFFLLDSGKQSERELEYCI